MCHIRPATDADFDAIWPIFQTIVAAGETYTYPRDTTKEQAFDLWMRAPRNTFVAFDEGAILGTYFIKTNQYGGGAHVCNCGYMVATAARGLGIARLMCEHSQTVAQELGYLAMQFNFVVSSNQAAVRCWTQLGFNTVGRLPQAFRHPELGFVDALVMFKWLAEAERM
jgi:L-amino acid N-acyltransferase YncA